jgi:hypothetical protein
MVVYLGVADEDEREDCHSRQSQSRRHVWDYPPPSNLTNDPPVPVLLVSRELSRSQRSKVQITPVRPPHCIWMITNIRQRTLLD